MRRDHRSASASSACWQITGNKALTGFTAPKILWVRKHEPQIYAQVAHILLPKDYVRYWLTGDYAVDKADGAGMLLFDLAQRDWSAEVLRGAGNPGRVAAARPTKGPRSPARSLPKLRPLTGLRAGTPVVAGGGDQAAQAVGVGAVTPGIVALTLGTSGVVFATTPQPFDRAGGPAARLLPRRARQRGT